MLTSVSILTNIHHHDLNITTQFIYSQQIQNICIYNVGLTLFFLFVLIN